MDNLGTKISPVGNYCQALMALSLSLMLQLVGYLTPGWIMYEMDTTRIQNGLWYVVECRGGNTSCTTVSTTDFIGDNINGRTWLLEFQVETTLALVLCIVSMVMFQRTRSTEYNTKYLVAGIACCGMSANYAVTASAVMAKRLLVANTMIAMSGGTDLYAFSYSAFLTGLGGIVDGVLCIFCIIKMCRSSTHRNDRNPEYNN